MNSNSDNFNIENISPDENNLESVPKVEKDDRYFGLSKMFQEWFLDYASYVILERAVPHLEDGLKPVQRRILHAMKKMDDGRYNKVANIIGNTMQYHPHGDASIGDALVQLGQKDVLIDCQGNWGNILTGDGAAAPRYIEARLSKFAKEVLFNPKTTNWKLSYDGRNEEPITLPVKFPLLLMQGAEGIAVGLSSKILPHNFNEICDAAIAELKEEEFTLYPDFPTGGFIDVERYNDGARGGNVKIRAKIEKVDNKTLVIKDLPYGKTTTSLVDSIIKANEKGKIKIRKVDDITAQNVEIQIQLPAGVSSDKTIDALYAFTDCEISIAPNCSIIDNERPEFLSVSRVLRSSVERTKNLLIKELEIEKREKQEALLFSSLEKIFIEQRIYKDKEFENALSIDDALAHIDKRIEPLKKSLIRDVTRDDLLRLIEIKMSRILKFNSDKADEIILKIHDDIEKLDYHLNHIIDYTINWFDSLKNKYGHLYPRKTIIRSFESIEATKVVEANEKLYIDREGGFVGTSLKKNEFVCNCSDIDDIIVFYKNGKYKIVKVAEKLFLGKDILYVNVFKKNDKRTIYNVVYRDGIEAPFYIKRFSITGVSRDKEYDVTKGAPRSRIVYFSVNANGEAEKIKIVLKPRPRQRVRNFEKDFKDIEIRGRQSIGNLLTKAPVYSITMKEKGSSTLGGRKIWFDEDVLRLNDENRGVYLGEFSGKDKILVIGKDGTFYTVVPDLSEHFDSDIERIEKFDRNKVWTCIFFDDEKQSTYLKRFNLSETEKKQSFIGENELNRLIFLTDTAYPMLEVPTLLPTTKSASVPSQKIDAEEFVGVKSYKARGKRVAQSKVGKVVELEPKHLDEEDEKDEREVENFSMGNDVDSESYDDNSEIDNNDDSSEEPVQTELF